MNSYSGIVGGSMVGIRFKCGVAIAADTRGIVRKNVISNKVDRVFAPSKKVIMGLGGRLADNMDILRMTENLACQDAGYGESGIINAYTIQHLMRKIIYERYNKGKPIIVDTMIGGLDNDNRPYLCLLDMRGNCFTKNFLVSSFGKHIVEGVFSDEIVDKPLLPRKEALKALHKALEQMYYRDCHFGKTYKVAIYEGGNASVLGPYSVDEDWSNVLLCQGHT